MDAGLYPADTCRVFILSLLQSIPVIPFEFFPFLLCGACQWKNQEQLNVCSLEILQELMTLRPIYCKECFVCMLSFASMLMKREGSGSISGSGSEYPGKLHTILVSALKNEQLFVQFLALATTQESSLQSTIQQFSSFTDGIVILSSDVDKHKAVQKSGIFSMTNTDASEGHMLRKKQEALLQDMTSMDFSFPLIAAVKCELAQIQTFIQYITTHQDSINSSVLQQLVAQRNGLHIDHPILSPIAPNHSWLCRPNQHRRAGRWAIHVISLERRSQRLRTLVLVGRNTSRVCHCE